MRTDGKKPWFRVKRYGYGAGLPISWEGWALVATYLASAILLPLLAPLPVFLTVFAILTTLVVLIAKARSDAEWRWRNGD